MTETTYKRRCDVLFTAVDEEVLALDVQHGHCFGMNLVASRVWALLEQPRSLADVCSSLLAEFEVDEDRCSAEVASLLHQFEADGLIRRQSAS